MIVFITTGYGKNVMGGSDIWCNNFIENVIPLLNSEYKIIVDNRPLEKNENIIYTWDNDDEVDSILEKCEKIIFLHHSYKENKLIKKWLHKTYLTFVHAFVPDMVGLKDEYENLMTRLDWDWQKQILDNSENIVWIGYENDTIHTYYPEAKTITNYYEWKKDKPFTEIVNNRIGYAARCETRKNADYLHNLPAFVFSNEYDYKRMLEASKINSEFHMFQKFDYKFHQKFFDKNFQIFHGAYTKEPFGYAIFDAIDNGKLPIIDSNWMKGIKYRYRAMNKQQFHYQWLRILEDGFEKNKKQFDRLKAGLQKYTDKQKWVSEICSYLTKYL